MAVQEAHPAAKRAPPQANQVSDPQPHLSIPTGLFFSPFLPQHLNIFSSCVNNYAPATAAPHAPDVSIQHPFIIHH